MSLSPESFYVYLSVFGVTAQEFGSNMSSNHKTAVHPAKVRGKLAGTKAVSYVDIELNRYDRGSLFLAISVTQLPLRLGPHGRVRIAMLH